ncbi:hypothetical protein IOQ59_16860 [Pontibacterium sp. N1Y112]|uniref:DUF2335 domain-containing protein n=1 Tax=Pontibacterium sinense TaxID=2781979 RepID=A0A8J7FF44_9GAMM|nr:hypothetical protein [Pontibacterium sinense]MBE9398932.1 hypothetical protein [Pontibacterium sinense]
MEKQELVAVNAEIERINDRVANIERIASTIEDVAEKGVEAFVKHLEHKEETQQKELDLEKVKHQRELELEDTVHKRSVFIISATVFCVVALVFTAMLLGEQELVKTILTSSLAVGAGFGIRSALTKSKGG